MWPRTAHCPSYSNKERFFSNGKKISSNFEGILIRRYFTSYAIKPILFFNAVKELFLAFFAFSWFDFRNIAKSITVSVLPIFFLIKKGPSIWGLGEKKSFKPSFSLQIFYLHKIASF